MMPGFIVAIAVAAILYCFFGYRLARLLLPLCGSLALFSLVYFILPRHIDFSWLELMIICASAALIMYIVLFLLKRFAGFIVGFVAVVFAVVIVVNLFGFSNVDIVSPILVTLGIAAALLSFVYQRTAVIVTSSLLGGCVAALSAILFFAGREAMMNASNIWSTIVEKMSEYSLVIAIIAVGLFVIGILVQLFFTSSKTLLPSKHEIETMDTSEQDEPKKKERNSFI